MLGVNSVRVDWAGALIIGEGCGKGVPSEEQDSERSDRVERIQIGHTKEQPQRVSAGVNSVRVDWAGELIIGEGCGKGVPSEEQDSERSDRVLRI